MIKTLISFYNLKLPIYFVYMLQQVEYRPRKFFDWLIRLVRQKEKINTVINRKTLDYTVVAKIMIISSYVLIFTILTILIVFLKSSSAIVIALLGLFILIPYLLVLFTGIFAYIGDKIYISPKQRRTIEKGRYVFSNHKAIKIAIIGSYGKTTMKEILSTLLAEKYIVASTPGNMNTLFSQANFALSLSGKEEVLIVEFGESEPGDIKKMTSVFKPDYAIITGLSPNHLDSYKTVEAIAKDMMAINEFVNDKNIFYSKESNLLKDYISEKTNTYSNKEVMGWKISEIVVTVKSTKFKMNKSSKQYNIDTSLLGRHQVAPLALGVAISDLIGLKKDQIINGISKIRPYEHRMQPRFVHGAWLIDDTYNGNLEGLKAGLKLLGELDMKRKWYVTPGLVDQGAETEPVHVELGKVIATISPDIVVLMENSVRPIIENSMKSSGFVGEIRVEKNPLDFYTNIEYIVADGDLVLMQNDWTDNYN